MKPSCRKILWLTCLLLLPATFGFPAEELIFTDDLSRESLERAVYQQIAVWKKVSAANRTRSTLQLGSRKLSVEDGTKALEKLLQLVKEFDDPRYLTQTIRENFDLMPMPGQTGKGDVLMTGYYHPVIKGSLTRTPEYPYPLYRLPHDMVTADLGQFKEELKGKRVIGRVERNNLVPYFDRRSIDFEGKLSRQGLEIAYVASDLDRFFLQIQGSGSILLPNGHFLPVHYDGQNGHPYRGIGGLLVEDGLLSRDELSMPAIRDLLDQDAELRESYLPQNPSYVFFSKGDGEPKGAGGALITPWRSIAVDRSRFPLGLAAFARYYLPVFNGDGEITSWQEIRGFVVTQDTGGAIKGEGRVDYYTGQGERAEKTAGRLAHYVEITFLLPKEG